MTVDSKEKGARAETNARDLLRSLTNLQWERVPGSGALGAQHKLKGDLYIVEANNKFCVEIKHYASDHFTSKIFTDKTPQWYTWWEQAVRQGNQVDKEPLLLFKFDRSKWFCSHTTNIPNKAERQAKITINGQEIVVSKLEDWLYKTGGEIQWV